MALFALLVAGCGAPGGSVAPIATRAALLPEPPPGLAIPPGDEAAAALASAPPGVRARYLVDLFDAARLLGDAPSRELLWRSLGPPEGAARGEAATRQAMEALAAVAERAGLSGLASLVDEDRDEFDGGEALAIATRRRALGASDDPGAGHALLALYASCARPLADAAAAPPWRRAVIADRCLYALHDADPEPYFLRDPSARPPDPPWPVLIDGLRRLLVQARARAPRLGGVVDRLSTQLDGFAETVDREGLAPPDITRLAARIPAGDATLPPYDREPWVIVDGDMAVVGRARFGPRDHELVARIERTLAIQRITGLRGRVALFVPAEGSADVIDSLCELARRGGAESVELVLSAPLSLRTPRGDVWAGRAPDRGFVVLPLQLRPATGRDRPRELDSRPPALTLLVAPDQVTAFASDGILPLGPIARAAPRVAELARAFPDEAQVALAIDPTASYRDVVATALAARAAFHRIALVDVPRPPPRDGFSARAKRRGAARFEAPGRFAARATGLRGCYLDAIDRDPALAGHLTVIPGTPPSLAEGGPADPVLRACLVHRAPALAADRPVRLEMAPR